MCIYVYFSINVTAYHIFDDDDIGVLGREEIWNSDPCSCNHFV